MAPEDIVVLCNHRKDCDVLAARIQGLGDAHGYACCVRTSRELTRESGVMLATTPHSCKGYDAESIVASHIENYSHHGSLRISNLYVVMTRARSMLWMAAVGSHTDAGRRIQDTLKQCLDQTKGLGALDSNRSAIDTMNMLRDEFPTINHRWPAGMVSSHHVSVATVHDDDGRTIAEPLFNVDTATGKKACFVQKPVERLVRDLNRRGIEIITPGERLE